MNDGDVPAVSVIVVTYNSAATVGETLDSLAAQTYPDYELIVVDGGSTDDTAAVVAEYDAAWIEAPGATIGACRNRGVDAADGEYVAFTDSDCAVPADWLESHVDRLRTYADDESVVGVGGPNRAFPGDPPFAHLVGSIQGTAFGSGGSPQSHAIDDVRFVGSVAACNVVYDASVFGGHRFDDAVNVGEDAEFHFRLSRAGYRFVFDPGTPVSHHLSATVGAFRRKSRSYGYAMARIQRRHRTVIRWYSALPSLALFGGGLAALSDLRARRLRAIPPLVAGFLLVTGIAAVQVYRDKRTPLALLVPLLLGVQYCYYGIGFLEGLAAPAGPTNVRRPGETEPPEPGGGHADGP